MSVPVSCFIVTLILCVTVADAESEICWNPQRSCDERVKLKCLQLKNSVSHTEDKDFRLNCKNGICGCNLHFLKMKRLRPEDDTVLRLADTRGRLRVVLYTKSEGCDECEKVEPKIEELADRYSNIRVVEFLKIDAVKSDRSDRTSSSSNVHVFPSVAFFSSGSPTYDQLLIATIVQEIADISPDLIPTPPSESQDPKSLARESETERLGFLTEQSKKFVAHLNNFFEIAPAHQNFTH